MMSPDRRRIFFVGIALGAVLATGLVALPDLVSGVTRAQEEAGRSGSDAILIRCKSAGQQFSISAYQGSVSTPARKTESCAETLAEMSRAGFKIGHVGYSDDADFVLYTLTR